MEDILYVQIGQRIKVSNPQVTLGDLGTFYCFHKDVVKNISSLPFYHFRKDEENVQAVFSITKVYEIIHKKYPDITIENEGETDFILQKEEKEKNKTLQYVKLVFASLVVFMGAAFTIMSFNEDVGTLDLFAKIYRLVVGRAKENGGTLLEISYCIGLPIGILLFYNHFRKQKRDLTPMEIEMRDYEESINKATIQTAGREGSEKS